MRKFKIRKMKINDFKRIMRLTDHVNWELTEEDFKIALLLEPEGCFVAAESDEPIGIAVTITYEWLGWIGSVIVERERRSQGVGKRLMKHSISYLIKKGVSTIGLYSYINTVPFYKKLGFRKNSKFLRLIGTPSLETSNHLKLDAPSLKDIIKFDKNCFGASREKLISLIYQRYPSFVQTYRKNRGLIGYAMAKPYDKSIEVGPICCIDEKEGGIPFMENILKLLRGKKIHTGIPVQKKMLTRFLKRLGLKEEFQVYRMYFGKPPKTQVGILAMESLERG